MPILAKKKWINDKLLRQFEALSTDTEIPLTLFSLAVKPQRKKLYKKETANTGLLAPYPRSLFKKKLRKNFFNRLLRANIVRDKSKFAVLIFILNCDRIYIKGSDFVKKGDKKSNMGGKANIKVTLLGIAIGAFCGVVMPLFLGDVVEKYGLYLGLVLEFALIIFTYFLHLIIHEVGHLIAGLISGYKFGSFRIGNIMLVKTDGKLKIKRHGIAGTGGQCLMRVPEPIDGEIPVIFYNLGGVLMNLFFVGISILFAAVCQSKSILYAFFVIMAMSGVIVSLTNGIPLKLGMINNDGSNALELSQNPEVRRFFYYQFKILEYINDGLRLRDMDESLFPMPSDDGMKNSISACGAVFLCNRLLDEGKFDETLILTDKLLSEKMH